METPRRILIACDKFKGSLDAPSACAAIARGLSTRFPHATIVQHPIADGGEGFAASLAVPLKGRWIETDSQDALGRPITARYLIADAPAGRLAVMEMAEASGMWRIRPAERDVMHSSTFGFGLMMRHAIVEQDAKHLVIGIGGSATNDGGAGMAAALGVEFLDAKGMKLPPTPAGLHERLVRIDASALIPMPKVTVACDVENPLLDPQGATRIYGPQKGADETTMPQLEAVLAAMVSVLDASTNANQAGAGAAGGLGFGLLHFAGADLVPGFELLASLTGFEAKALRSDWVITGEGSLDSQSLMGKGPVAVAKLAARHGKKVHAFCGRAEPAIKAAGCFDSITELSSTGLLLEILMRDAEELLEKLASEMGDEE
jgi:glycerate kinase